MKAVKYFVRFTDKMSVSIGEVVSYFMLLVMGSAVIEIVSRYFFGRPTIWSYEFGQFLFGAYFLLVGAITSYYREHIGMDLLITKLSPRKQAILNSITFFFTAIFCIVLVYKGSQFAYKSIINLEHSTSVWGPPLYPLKAMLPFAGLLIFLQTTSNFIKDLYLAVTGRCWAEEVEDVEEVT